MSYDDLFRSTENYPGCQHDMLVHEMLSRESLSHMMWYYIIDEAILVKSALDLIVLDVVP